MAEIIDDSTSAPTSEGAVQLETALSKKGNKYETAPKSARAPRTDDTTVYALPVDWPVDDKWHIPSPEFTTANGITSYIVGHSQSPFYDYYIQIVTNDDYDYFFQDQTSDQYEIDVFDTSTQHITRYSSSEPTIVEVLWIE